MVGPGDWFIKDSVHILVWSSSFLPAPHRYILVTRSFFSKSVILGLWEVSSFVSIFRLHLEVISFDTCLSLSPFLHLEWLSLLSWCWTWHFFLLLYGWDVLDCISSVQLLSRVRLFGTPWTAARQASLFITNSQRPPKPMSIESVMPSNHLILYRPLLLLPSIFPSIRVFSNESALCIRWPKYWSFSFNISPSNEHPGLIFRMDWLNLLAVQGTLKSLLQHHSSKASIVWHSTL